MNQKEFLKDLRENLLGLPEEDIEEIIGDYREHFKVGKKKNRKESEIAKSLGNPKEIAREARRELREGSELSLSEELIEFRIRAKKLFKSFWKNVKKNFPKLIKRFGKSLRNLGKSQKKKGVKKKKAEKKSLRSKKRSSLKITLLILLDFLVVLWVWIGLFAVIISLIVSGWAIALSGIVSILAILFGLAMPFSGTIGSLLLSGLFASLGVACLGLVFSIVFWKLGKGFFWLTGKYLKWNNKVFGGKK